MKTLRLTLTVQYTPNGTSDNALYDLLYDIARHAAGDGLMTGETPAEVNIWSSSVEVVPNDSI